MKREFMRLWACCRSRKMGCATTTVKITAIALNAILGVSMPPCMVN